MTTSAFRRDGWTHKKMRLKDKKIKQSQIETDDQEDGARDNHRGSFHTKGGTTH